MILLKWARVNGIYRGGLKNKISSKYFYGAVNDMIYTGMESDKYFRLVEEFDFENEEYYNGICFFDGCIFLIMDGV